MYREECVRGWRLQEGCSILLHEDQDLDTPPPSGESDIMTSPPPPIYLLTHLHDPWSPCSFQIPLLKSLQPTLPIRGYMGRNHFLLDSWNFSKLSLLVSIWNARKTSLYMIIAHQKCVLTLIQIYFNFSFLC